MLVQRYRFSEFLTSESGETLGVFILTGAARQVATGHYQSEDMLSKNLYSKPKEFSSQIVFFFWNIRRLYVTLKNFFIM